MSPVLTGFGTRVLFLDFDGVLHPSDAGDPPEEGALPRPGHFEWAFELDRLLAPGPDIRIVIHSSWRILLSERALRTALPERLARRMAGTTSAGFPREASIVEWMRINGAPISWAILDDEPDEFEELVANLIICRPFSGLSDPEVQDEISSWVARS